MGCYINMNPTTFLDKHFIIFLISKQKELNKNSQLNLLISSLISDFKKWPIVMDYSSSKQEKDVLNPKQIR